MNKPFTARHFDALTESIREVLNRSLLSESETQNINLFQIKGGKITSGNLTGEDTLEFARSRDQKFVSISSKKFGLDWEITAEDARKLAGLILKHNIDESKKTWQIAKGNLAQLQFTMNPDDIEDWVEVEDSDDDDFDNDVEVDTALTMPADTAVFIQIKNDYADLKCGYILNSKQAEVLAQLLNIEQ